MERQLTYYEVEATHDRLKQMCTNAGNFEMYDKLCATFDNQGLKDLLAIIEAEVLDQRLDAYHEGYANAQYKFTGE